MDEAQINQQLHNAALSDLRQVRELQRASNSEGITLSRKEARAVIARAKQEQLVQENKVRDAQKQAQPEWLKDGGGLLGGGVADPIGPVFPMTPPADPGDPRIIGRLPFPDDEGGTLTTVNFQVGPMIYQGKISVTDLGPVSP